MNTDPLNAIGQFFEMPTKEAFLDKVQPTLSFFWYNNPLNSLGLIFMVAIGLITFLILRQRK